MSAARTPDWLGNSILIGPDKVLATASKSANIAPAV